MVFKWVGKALSDMARLYEFLAAVNQPAAASVVQALTATPTRLLLNPFIGEKFDEFEPRKVRRIFAGQYEMRYEIHGQPSMCCGFGIRERIGSVSSINDYRIDGVIKSRY
jgi:plasmid stabilization system protein ParE